MTSKNHLFASNLRTACAMRHSISELCREIGMNRQQFNRYIHGETLPSVYNQGRIASAFGLASIDFFKAPAAFSAALSRPQGRDRVGEVLKDGFPGNLEALKEYLGYYQTYHLSMSWPGRIVCSCVHMRKEGGLVVLTTRERIADPGEEIRQVSKYVGMVAYWRDRIFIVERSVGRHPLISQTTLHPFEQHQRVYLKGVTTGVSWRRGNLPYASRMIWRAMGLEPDLRALLSRCGAYAISDRRLPEPVTRFLEPVNPQLVSIVDDL